MARATDIYYKISPFSLAAIVLLNFLLIYLNLLNLENQSTILQRIEQNTEIALVNQELGLNSSQGNAEILNAILELEEASNKTIQSLNLTGFNQSMG